MFSGRVERSPRTIPAAIAVNPSEAGRQQIDSFRFLFQHHSDALNWVMLKYAIIFFVIALVAEALGAFGVAGEAAWIAHVLIVIAVIFIIISFFSGRRGPPIV
jgi:uncharacterized membrane protein YtjA (UPF0391 family)